MKRPGQFYLVIYVLATVFTLGGVWFVKNMISHAIYDANQQEKKQ